MNLEDFAGAVEITKAKEIERVALLVYFQFQTGGHNEFLVSDLKPMFQTINVAQPNPSRLIQNIRKSRLFIKGAKADAFRLHADTISEFSARFGSLLAKPKEVQSDGSILPDSLLIDKRAYIQRYGKQINASYSAGIFDGCAVLMRRLVEICLIHVYENAGLLSSIEESPGRYKDLRLIIDDAVLNSTIALTKDSRDCLDSFRILGNLSAHKLFYNCRSEEIQKVKLQFRLLIEELFNKAGKKVEP